MGQQEDKLIKLSDVLQVIHNVAANYPTDIWPDNGDTLDCKGAKMARLTCENIERGLKELDESD
jgi:hypothetical protein